VKYIVHIVVVESVLFGNYYEQYRFRVTIPMDAIPTAQQM